ncbi:MAG: TRAP transporter substrate-binding protein, partial [Halothiobacillaceae bacterium]
MNRRDFLTRAGVGALAAGTMAGCTDEEKQSAGVPATTAGKPIRWRMVTAWPRNFPGLGTGANRLAETIGKLSGGRLTVEVNGAGEVVPALEVFDAVAAGTAEMGHSAAYYWQGKMPAAPFFSAVPFGFTADEMNSWLYFGGGLDLWRELYEPFGVLPLPAGNTGPQMSGWFRKPIESLDDFKGLKIRLPGIAGEVLRKLGATVVNIPGSELFQSLADGTIDAAEWVGPYNDLAFGFYRSAPYYYGPSWHEPASTMEAILNREAFEALPEDLQEVVVQSCMAVNDSILAEYTARNAVALRQLADDHGVEVRRFPE